MIADSLPLVGDFCDFWAYAKICCKNGLVRNSALGTVAIYFAAKGVTKISNKLFPKPTEN